MADKTDDPRSFLPLPHLEFQILVSLAGADLHGYAIVKDVEQRTQGTTTPSTGSLYLAIARLLESGLIEEPAAAVEAGGRKRRIYRITGFGRAVAEAETERLGTLAQIAGERLRSREPVATGGSRGQR